MQTTPSINYEKTELEGGGIVKVEVVLVVVWGFCLAAQEEPGFLD